MAIDPRAGKTPTADRLVNVPRLVTNYYSLKPTAEVKSQRVAFGTSGHRGSSMHASFNEDHILAITQAICEYRKQQGTTGPLFLGIRYTCFIGAGFRQCARSAGGKRRRSDDRVRKAAIRRRRRCRTRFSRYNQGRSEGLGRRHRDHAVAQSSGRWWIQVQSAERRPCGHERDEMD